MEITQKKSSKNNGKRVLRCFIFFFLFSLFTPQISIAQTTSDSAVQSSSEDGPSLNNIKKNMAAGNEELKKSLEKAKHDEFMSYVYMGLGFSVVIFIAWFTTSVARKRKKKDDAIKLLRHQNTKHHDHSHRKGAHAKR
jgi:hypothetical protein